MSRIDRVRNEEVCRRAGVERVIVSSTDQRVLGLFVHVEKYGWVPYGQKGFDGGSKRRSARGRPKLGWMDGVKVTLGNTGMKA